MSENVIGIAEKNPARIVQPESGIAFEVPYGEDRYGITLSGEELDAILDKGYEAIMGRCALAATAHTLYMDGPGDTLLYADATTLDIELERNDEQDWVKPPQINLGIGIISKSLMKKVKGIAHANRSGRSDCRWMFVRYENLLQENHESLDSSSDLEGLITRVEGLVAR